MSETQEADETEEQSVPKVSAPAERIRRMLTKASLGGLHEDVALELREDEVRILASWNGKTVISYCSYEPTYFAEYEPGEESVIAILNVSRTLTYLSIAETSGRVEMSFKEVSDGLASRAVFEGSLRASRLLSASGSAQERIPDHIPERYDEDENHLNRDKSATLPVTIQTTQSQIMRVVDAVNADEEEEFYPVSVQDGEFRIDVGDESRATVTGTLAAKDVEGPDVQNHYFDGFEPIFESVEGNVRLQTAPDGAPLSIVVEGPESVHRHLLATVEG